MIILDAGAAHSSGPLINNRSRVGQYSHHIACGKRPEMSSVCERGVLVNNNNYYKAVPRPANTSSARNRRPVIHARCGKHT